MSNAFGRVSSNSTSNNAANPNNDMEVNSPPTDGISSLTFSPVANHLIATSWDNKVRCWEIGPQGQSVPKAFIDLPQPVICSAWSADGTTVFAGGCDKQVTMWSLANNATQVVANHEQPIVRAMYVPEMNNMLVTGSWDRTIKYWDLRQPNPVHTQQLQERVYAIDIKYPLLVVALAGRKIQVYNLTNPQQIFREIESPLKYQSRSLACFPDASGYLLGSVEGRVAVQHVDESSQSKSFTFKCHRDGNDVYAVNSICFHPVHGTFVTAGADGSYNFWDKDSKQRLKAMGRANLPISCSHFNKDGTIYAYALSYDWSRGYSAYEPSTARNSIMLHSPVESEVLKRPANSRTTRR